MVGITQDGIAGHNIESGDRVRPIVEERVMALVLMLHSCMVGYGRGPKGEGERYSDL